jgi:hypothetical protein
VENGGFITWGVGASSFLRLPTRAVPVAQIGRHTTVGPAEIAYDGRLRLIVRPLEYGRSQWDLARGMVRRRVARRIGEAMGAPGDGRAWVPGRGAAGVSLFGLAQGTLRWYLASHISREWGLEAKGHFDFWGRSGRKFKEFRFWA